MNWSVIGLIFDIIGVILLFASTEIYNRILEKMIHAASSGSQGNGIFRGSAMLYIIENSLKPKKKWANFLSRGGLLLILIGFALQLIGSMR